MAQKKIYDKEFKIQVVKLGREIGFSKAAKELGVNINVLIQILKERRPLEVENTLSKKIDTAGQNASYDAYCRNLLINK